MTEVHGKPWTCTCGCIDTPIPYIPAPEPSETAGTRPLDIRRKLNGDYVIPEADMPYGPPLDLCPECLLEEIRDRVDGADPEYGLMYRLVLAGRFCQSFRHSAER